VESTSGNFEFRISNFEFADLTSSSRYRFPENRIVFNYPLWTRVT